MHTADFVHVKMHGPGTAQALRHALIFIVQVQVQQSTQSPAQAQAQIFNNMSTLQE